MSTEREVQVIRDMLKRKYWAGLFFGIGLAAFLTVGILNGAANPEIADSTTLTHSAEEIAHHSALIDVRNYAAIVGSLSIIISFFLDRSVQDLSR